MGIVAKRVGSVLAFDATGVSSQGHERAGGAGVGGDLNHT